MSCSIEGILLAGSSRPCRFCGEYQLCFSYREGRRYSQLSKRTINFLNSNLSRRGFYKPRQTPQHHAIVSLFQSLNGDGGQVCVI